MIGIQAYVIFGILFDYLKIVKSKNRRRKYVIN